MGRASSVPLGTARPASAALATAEQPEQGLPPTAALIGRSGGVRRAHGVPRPPPPAALRGGGAGSRGPSGLRPPRRRARRLWWRVRLPVGACPDRLGGEPRLGRRGLGGRRRRGRPLRAGRGLRRSRWLLSTVGLGRELVLGLERVMALVLLGHDCARARLAGDGALDRELGGLVVVVLDLAVVRRFPVDEDADADEQILALALGDRALGDAVRHR